MSNPNFTNKTTCFESLIVNNKLTIERLLGDLLKIPYMKRIMLLMGFNLMVLSLAFSQNRSEIITFPLKRVVNAKEQSYDKWAVVLKHKPVKNHFGGSKAEKLKQELIELNKNSTRRPNYITPSKSSLKLNLGVNFKGMYDKSAHPLDDAMDISTKGNVLHAVNHSLMVKNLQGDLLLENTLNAFFNTKGAFDPRVAYDHYEDRFIIAAVTFPGAEVVIGFSKTNDPSGEWNIYTLDIGTYLEFPHIAVTEYELLITYLDEINNDNNFQHRLLQISKKEGYAGNDLRTRNHLILTDSAGRLGANALATSVGQNDYGTKAYMVSIEQGTSNNAKFYEITDTLGGNPTIKTSQIEFPEEYAIGGNVAQQGNDVPIRVISERINKAVYYNGKVHAVFGTNLNQSGDLGIYYVEIDVNDHKVNHYTYKKSNSDLVNPSLDLIPVKLAEGSFRIAIGYHETNKDMLPTLNAIVLDEKKQWTEPLVVNQSKGYLPPSGQDGRLGDYTSCVARDFRNSAFWVSGEVGDSSNKRSSWIGEVLIKDLSLDEEDIVSKQPTKIKLIPNPVRESVMISFDVTQDIDGKISLYGISGNLIKILYEGILKAGENRLSFDMATLSTGTYIVKLEDKKGELITKKLLKK